VLQLVIKVVNIIDARCNHEQDLSFRIFLLVPKLSEAFRESPQLFITLRSFT